jgi:hypothetical protein
MTHVERTQDLRCGERRPFRGAVRVSWQTRSGEMRTIQAKCIDLSEQGVRIECDQPIDLQTNVYLHAPSFGLMGNAWVRHCRRNGLKHVMGLLFSSAASQAEQGRKRLIRNQPGREQ